MLDKIEKILKILRELGLVAVLGGVAYFVGPEAPRIAKELQKASVSEVDLGFLKLKVAQAETALQTALQASAGQAGLEDAKAPEQSTLIAQALESVREASSSVAPTATTGTQPATQPASFWVYLGSRRDAAWQTSFFDLQQVPAAGSIIQAASDVFGRQRAPELSNGQWTKGDTVGVLKAGQAVKVVQVQRVPGTNARELWWAQVTPQ